MAKEAPGRATQAALAPAEVALSLRKGRPEFKPNAGDPRAATLSVRCMQSVSQQGFPYEQFVDAVRRLEGRSLVLRATPTDEGLSGDDIGGVLRLLAEAKVSAAGTVLRRATAELQYGPEIADTLPVVSPKPAPTNTSVPPAGLNELDAPPSASGLKERIGSLAALSRSLVEQLSKPPAEPWADQVADVAAAFRELGATLRAIAAKGPAHAAWEAREALFMYDHPDAVMSDDRTLDAPAAQFLLGLSKARVYQLAEAKRIGARVENSWRFSHSELRAFALSDRASAGRNE